MEMDAGQYEYSTIGGHDSGLHLPRVSKMVRYLSLFYTLSSIADI